MAEQGRTLAQLLENLLRWGERLECFLAGVERDDFQNDELRQAAASKCVEAIGEASGEIQRRFPNFATAHSHLQLAEAYRARNRLSHGYDTIDWQILWDTATIYVPHLVSEVRRLRSPDDKAPL